MRGFDAYPQRQFMTESINNNRLADHHIWSTIKTLPATLPEPSSKVPGSSPKHICPRTSATGSIASGCLGVTGAVCNPTEAVTRKRLRELLGATVQRRSGHHKGRTRGYVVYNLVADRDYDYPL